MPVIDDIRESNKMVKGKGFKYAFDYFLEYYKYPTLAVIVAVIVIVSLIRTFVTAKDVMFEVAYINSYGTPSEESCSAYFNLDVKKQSVAFDNSYQITTDSSQGYSQTSYSSSQKLAAVVASKTLDVVICNPDIYDRYMNSLFGNLDDFFDKEFLDSLGDRVIYGERVDTTTGEILGSFPLAIDVTHAPQLSGCYSDKKTVYFTVVGNAPHADDLMTFYNFLYTEPEYSE